MATSTENPFDFQRISPTISLYTSSQPTSSVKKGDPTTIIICPWLGVHPKSRTLNSVYIKYHALYPHARIISIRTLPQYFLTTTASSRLSSIHHIIPAIASDPAPEKRVLAHIFSNGGAVTFSDMCQVYKQATGKLLPIKAIILDSAPGDPNFREGWAIVSSSGAIPTGLLWYPAATTIVIVLGLIWFGKNILRIKTLVELSRGLLNDKSLVNEEAKRLYVYSEADRVVGWTDVESHAEEARQNGWDVKLLKEDESPHVQHLLLDQERYWQRVEDLWRNAS